MLGQDCKPNETVLNEKVPNETVLNETVPDGSGAAVFKSPKQPLAHLLLRTRLVWAGKIV